MSGVGKGTATASIGRILKEHGFSVTAVKIDPYINYDAGTLRPTEHGEVWVTDDGGEIDQDLGNYERFLDIDIPRKNNITTGQIYKEIIDRERKGEFLGQTVQFIPHVPEEIKRRIKEAAQYTEQGASRYHDFVLLEIGGTVGDYENLPFLFATKSLEVEIGRENVCHILVTYMPIPSHISEMKTKPTQQAIRTLNEAGIFPDFVLCRATRPLDDVRKKKIETYANIPSDRIISAPDIKTIYEIPLNFEKERLGKKILERFGLQPRKVPDWNRWNKFVSRIENPSSRITIAIVGKYVDIGDYALADSYISVNQALEHAGAAADAGVDIKWVDSKLFEKDRSRLQELKNYSGIIIPGGFGSSGVEGKIAAIKFARENDVPFLGLCYGLQLAVIEAARSIGMDGANTTEVDGKTKYPVIDVLPAQKQILQQHLYGGSMRLGAYAAVLENSRVLDLYKRSRLSKDKERITKLSADKTQLFRLGILNKAKNVILERHRHRYEVNPKFARPLEKSGLVFSGHHLRTDKTKLMEFIELPKHRFFIGTQAHPEFKSRLGDPAPLFLGFVEACRE